MTDEVSQKMGDEIGGHRQLTNAAKFADDQMKAENCNTSLRECML